jgi:nitrogen fixation-related uncharacterized protein
MSENMYITIGVAILITAVLLAILYALDTANKDWNDPHK